MPRREFQEFTDPGSGLIWKVDISFLTSTWGCIYGQGCQGVYPEGSGKSSVDGGCCTLGVYLDDKDEIAHVQKMAKRLTAEDWQLRELGRSTGFLVRGDAENGPKKTRVVKGSCIFNNREGFAGGIGCAFHHHAVRTGQHPADVKPHACWMLPLRDDILEEDEDGEPTKQILTDYRTKDWGEGIGFTWYCMDRPEAFSNPSGMVYRTQEYEIRKMIGDEVYDMVVAYIETRLRSRSEPIPMLPMQKKAMQRKG